MIRKKKSTEFEAILVKIGKIIKEKRLEKGMTQADMDTDPYAILLRDYQNIEYGKRNITLVTLLKLCEKLNIHPRELFEFEVYWQK